MTPMDTRETILKAARSMVQAHGYNALSFRELAKEVGVKSASVHYHFPTKGDLGVALARRYTDDLVAYLETLSASSKDEQRWSKYYTDVFREPLINDNRMCLVGIMAAEHSDLPAEVRKEVDRFTDANVDWLAHVLSVRTRETDKQALQQRAMAIFAAIEGAQLLARSKGDVSVFDTTISAYRSAGLLP
ncbi:TetR/AcrR family transcriptional repressor of nem operon [Rhizobium ruizarguesonis]